MDQQRIKQWLNPLKQASVEGSLHKDFTRNSDFINANLPLSDGRTSMTSALSLKG
jgi:hypothetical protein